MDDKERRKIETSSRILGFGTAHAEDFTPESLGKKLFAEMSTIVARLSGHASSQASGRGVAQQGTTTRRSAREELRSDLEALSRTASVCEEDVPGIADMFRVPHNNNDQELLAFARAVVVKAPPFATLFISHELPADFIQDLQDDITALEKAISEQASGTGEHVSARAEIRADLEAAELAKRKLHVIIRNKYANNAGVLAEWTSASHTERAPKHKKTEPPKSADPKQ